MRLASRNAFFTRQNGLVLIGNLLLFSLLGLSGRAGEPIRTPVSATVLGVRGQARCTTDGKVWDLLEPGDKVRAGTLIQTGITNAELDLQLGEARIPVATNAPTTRLRLFENSILGLKKISLLEDGANPRKEVELDLRSGQMQASVEPGSIDCEVEFPTGVAGIRGAREQTEGTSFLLFSSGGIAVFSGRVVISLADTQSAARLVRKGERMDSRTREVAELPPDAPERKFQSLSPLFP